MPYCILFFVNPALLYFPELDKALLGERSVDTTVATKSLKDLKIRYRKLVSEEAVCVGEGRKA
jgi:hypothetical protein